MEESGVLCPWLALWPHHAQSTENACSARLELADAAIDSPVEEPGERAEHVGAVPAASGMADIAPADIIAEQCTERVQVVGNERLLDLFGQGLAATGSSNRLHIVAPAARCWSTA